MASVASDIVRLAVRLGVGGVLAFDGYQKIQTWYRDRAGAAAAAVDPVTSATPIGRKAGLAAGVSEAAGGVLLVLGIATPATGAAAASSMALTATGRADGTGNAPRNITGGFEIPAALGVGAAALALAGPGRISIDHLLGNRLANRPAAIASLFATVSSTALVVIRRSRAGGAASR